MRDVYVIGGSQTKFGELFDRDMENLISEAFFSAIKEVGIEKEKIEAAWVGTAIKQNSIPAALTARATGLIGIPITRVENACVSGTEAVRNAYFSIALGYYDVVIAVGVEKMRDGSTSWIAKKMAVRNTLWEEHLGMPGPANFALYATRHMHEFGTTKEMMAEVAVKNHEYGVHNPYAQFRRKIKVEDVLNSPIVAWPFGILDCSPASDGAAVVILSSKDGLNKLNEKPDVLVKIKSCAIGTDYSLHGEKESLVEFKAAKMAANEAYKRAKVTPDNIDVAELHDCFTCTEIILTEDLGFCKKGEGGKFVVEGETRIGGKIPVNTSGGLKACGHPIGATGVRQVLNIYKQLIGNAGKVQVEGANIGLAQTIGGQTNVAGIIIMERVK